MVEVIGLTESPKYCATAAIKPGADAKPVPGKPTSVDMPVDAPTKLKDVDLTTGTGPAAKKGNYVTLDYLGISCPTGVEFDSSWGKQPLPVTVGEGVIEGFSNGVLGMKKGGLRRVEIPWQQAYGVTGQPPTIGPREPLVFVIAVREIADKAPTTTTVPVPATPPTPPTPSSTRRRAGRPPRRRGRRPPRPPAAERGGPRPPPGGLRCGARQRLPVRVRAHPRDRAGQGG